MAFRDFSIRRKLMVIIMLTTFLAVVLVSIAFLAYDSKTFSEKIEDDLAILTETMASNTERGVVFNDSDTTNQLLAGLARQTHITGAWIFKENKLFGSYIRTDQGERLVDEIPETSNFVESGEIVVVRPIFLGDTSVQVANLQVRSDLEEIKDRRAQISQLLLLVILGVTLVAFVVSALLQRLISQPVLDLVGVVRQVSDEKNYAARATKQSNDELGKLIDGFNDMLGQIELRDEELVVARDRAEQANRSKSVFLANMSHELRTPLTAIIGYSEILEDDARELGMTDFLPDLQKIHAAGKHLLGLINSILDLSKVEAGKMDLLPEKFEVKALIDEVRATAQPLMEKNGNTLEVQLGENVDRVMNDLTKTRQILLNLLSNAAKFTENGRVVLEARREPGKDTDWLILKVTDSGIGMTPEQLKKLFKPFSQAEASTARDYGGTGLGLALSKRFTELMQGRIKVESEPGKGSAFTVRLPTNVVSAKQHERTLSQMIESGEWAAKSGAERPLGADSHLVLVIDDDLAVHDLLRDILTREGFRVATAKDGPEGLRMARELQPAIITLDVKMPGKDGWSVLNELRSEPSLESIPVIMISVSDEAQRGYALGAEYLTKPIDRQRLTELLRKYRGQNQTPAALVVDDDPNIRGVLVRLLEEQSWEVDEAENGIAALRRVADTTPDLILLDLMMPQMNGFDFVAQLRKNTAWQNIPIVVLTAMDLGPDELARLNGGVERVLEKGAYSLDELKREIRAFAVGVVEPKAP